MFSLQETGIGKLVNGFRKHSSEEVAEFSKDLVKKWKQLIQGPAEETRETCGKRPKKEKNLQVYFYRPIKKQRERKCFLCVR